MAEEQPVWAGLLKYPVTIFTVLVALIIAKYALGITFGPVKRVGPSGIEFVQDAKAAIVDLDGKLRGLAAKIEAMKRQLVWKALGPRPAQMSISRQAQISIFKATQTVSDQTARLAKFSAARSRDASKPTGFIWIGDYKNGWSKVMLGAVETGQPITVPPKQLLPGTEYRVRGNMIVRDGLPSNDAVYFRGRKSLGVIARGTKIRLVKTPMPINRRFAVQYWAEVELP
ncbi:MAG: hypothetical protein KJ621_07915 [Proteobacteria bacterium]|nr:hypothetical protein [Pseudomonadota bacterium]MBU1742277.1 hypothetical protein [Pseudomonadota bacterium]